MNKQSTGDEYFVKACDGGGVFNAIMSPMVFVMGPARRFKNS